MPVTRGTPTGRRWAPGACNCTHLGRHRRLHCTEMGSRRGGVRKKYESLPLPIWQELLIGVEMVCLRVSPAYWGLGIPHGDGSAVVVIPGFMGTDLYLAEFRAW